MHCVNWNILRVPKSHGGLGILDLFFSNLMLGAKILWRLVIGKQEWWKKVLVNKYLEGDRLRCPDSSPPCQPSCPIWKLLKASLPLFQRKATWILGIGHQISIWRDNIMGNLPLQEEEGMQPPISWCSEHGINTLFDLSKWHSHGSWDG